GDGPSTILKAADSSSPVFVLAPPLTSVSIHDFAFQRGGTGSGTSVAISCLSTTGNPMSDLRLARLWIDGFPAGGIRIEGFDALDARISRVSLLECDVRNCGGTGISLVNAVEAYATGLLATANAGKGMSVSGGSVAVYGSSFDKNSLTNLHLTDCFMARVD